MQADFLDRYSRGTSLVHRLDARLKIVLAVGLVIAVVATSLGHWPFYALEAALVLAVYAVARLPWRYLALRLMAVLPFLLMLSASVPLAHALDRGWDLAAQLFVRSLLSLTVMITLVSTTPFSVLLGGLGRLGMPRVVLSILAFMYRYMFVLTDELEKMRRAKLARTFYPSFWAEIGLMARFVGILFVRAFERAERVYAAMCARGWNGDMPR